MKVKCKNCYYGEEMDFSEKKKCGCTREVYEHLKDIDVEMDCEYYTCMTNAEKLNISNFEEMLIMLEEMVKRVTCCEDDHNEEIRKWMNTNIDEM